MKKRKIVVSVYLSVLVFGVLSFFGLKSIFPGKVAEAFPGLKTEFMPPFDEGAFLYMPTTMPHASFGQSQKMLADMDTLIAEIPEVDRVIGKMGRADSPLDPAPINMFEVLVTYHSEFGKDKKGNRVRKWRDHIRSPDDIWKEITKAASLMGTTSAPKLMPISTRIIMLQSGMRAPMGIKIQGPSIEIIETFGLALEGLLKESKGVKTSSVAAQRMVGKPYLEIHTKREMAAAYGLSPFDIQMQLKMAVGGIKVSEIQHGRERFALTARYQRDFRESADDLERLFIRTKKGEAVELKQVADVVYTPGPQVIKSEDTFPTGYVFFEGDKTFSDSELVSHLEKIIEKAEKNKELIRPAGISISFAGTYENQIRAQKRLSFLIPLAIAVIILILYVQFKSLSLVGIIFSSVLLSVSGAFILFGLYGYDWFLNFNLGSFSLRKLFSVQKTGVSVASWVGVIALVGIATDDAVVMCTYLMQGMKKWLKNSHTLVYKERMVSLREYVAKAAQRRVRPCLMTTATTLLAILPVLGATGRGADVMRPIALPVAGGMLFITGALIFTPVFFTMYWERRLRLDETSI